MCFTVENPNNPNAKIAKEDIIVYKILKDSTGGWGHSPYYGTLWQRGGSLESKIVFESDGCEITKGIHAYQTYVKAKQSLVCWPTHGESIYKFIVPYGAVYYTNSISQEIVSNRMIWATRGYLIQRFLYKIFKTKTK